MSKIVIDATIPEATGARQGRGTEPINPVQEIKSFLTGKENEIRKAFNGNDPAEITGTTPAGVQCTVMVITEELREMNSAQDQAPAGSGREPARKAVKAH